MMSASGQAGKTSCLIYERVSSHNCVLLTSQRECVTGGMIDVNSVNVTTNPFHFSYEKSADIIG